ncbi:hypothetical protein ACFOYW_03525 [Gryllotalpicola reticulitermitis]|uniref:Tfp pilus assembly protein PilO n=1 Tax=Gryllotalpicola reticulitermitis TaxID=1184153 RepID=A0ABV8Q3B2_9MICO
MNANRLWMLGGAVVAVAIAVLAYFVGIAPQLAQAQTAEQQKAQAQTQLQQTEVALATLKKQYASIDQLTAQLTALQQSVPGTTNVTDFVRQVQGQASATGSTITSISVGEPTAYAPQAAPGAPTSSGSPAATPAPTATATPAPGATTPATGSTPQPNAASSAPTPNATAVAVAPPLQTAPSITASNFVLLPVSIAASGSEVNLLAFTKELQTLGPRLFLVDSIDVKQGTAPTATIAGFIYVLIGN